MRVSIPALKPVSTDYQEEREADHANGNLPLNAATPFELLDNVWVALSWSHDQPPSSDHRPTRTTASFMRRARAAS